MNRIRPALPSSPCQTHTLNELRNSDDLAPFALVIDVNKEQAGKELFELVKAAEGPYHNRLTKGELSRDRQNRLQELFRELSGKVREHLPKINREGFDLRSFFRFRNRIG